MISIVICTRGADISADLKDNIARTIGVEFELVIIDNSMNRYSIFSAYNEGMRQSKGDVICFMHDDVTFKSDNWGMRVMNHFMQCGNLGILGVAGSHFLSSYPMYWSSSPLISEHYNSNDCGVVEKCYKEDFYQSNGLSEVVACDGMCLFAKKELFNVVTFDEDTYKGFHMYDMDICMQAIVKGYKVCVCNDVLIEHQWSESNVNKKGMELFYPNLERFTDKWKMQLPMVKGLDFLPQYVMKRLNNMVGYGYDAMKARQSWSYRVGAMILKPFKVIRDLLK